MIQNGKDERHPHVMDHCNPQSVDRQQQPDSLDENINNGDNQPSPRRIAATESSIVSPESSSLGSPTLEIKESPHDVPLGQFHLDHCDDDRDEQNISTMSIEGGDHSAHSNGAMPRASLYSTISDVNDDTEDYTQFSDHANELQRVPSLSLSAHSGYDTDEDEDGVLRRFHDQAKSSLHMNLSLRSDDDDGSVYSAVNTEDAEETTRSGGFGDERRKKKRPAEHIKDAIHGMRKAHQDAQRERSTRQFLAMSEGRRTAHSFTEAICLSSWCDFNSGRGMVVMLGVLIILVAVVVALIKFEHLAGGVWTLILGVVIILLRRFWVPIYWLVWGQFVEKRRRRNMQRYDTLYGGRGKTESVQTPGRIESELELNDQAGEFENKISNNVDVGELA